MRRRTLRDLSPFFERPKASALLVTDAKLDDTLALWIFCLLNFGRPADHKVELKVLVLGIQDLAAGAALISHVFSEARAEATRQRPTGLPAVELEVLLSENPAAAPIRHEAITYAPYRSGAAAGFPAPKGAGELRSMRQLLEATPGWAADLVLVIAQYFEYEVVVAHKKGALRLDALAPVVPAEGGALVIQSGFNTRMEAEEAEGRGAWRELQRQLEARRASLVFISNAFSFRQGGPKPGTLSPGDSPFVAALKSQSPALWEHLFKAGLSEAAVFCTDQMAKWLTKLSMPGVNYDEGGLGSAIDEARASLPGGLAGLDMPGVSALLMRIFLEERERDPTAPNTVVELCKTLRAKAEAAAGAKAADYLGRAVGNFEKYGKTVEVTDGQHLLAIFQSRSAVLAPATVDFFDPAGLQVDFAEEGLSEGSVWAARDVDAAESLRWMEDAVELQNFSSILSPPRA